MPSSRSSKPNDTSASRKSRAARGCRPRRAWSAARSPGSRAGSVRSLSSTAVSTTLAVMKLMPISMIRRAVGRVIAVLRVSVPGSRVLWRAEKAGKFRPCGARSLARGDDVVEARGNGRVALKMRIAQAIVILDACDAESIAILQYQFDRRLRAARLRYGIFQYVAA